MQRMRYLVRNLLLTSDNKSNATFPIGIEVDESTLKLIQIFFDTDSFDEIERDKEIKLTNQISLIGGTMGLFTGFSIISGIELIYFAAKFFLRSTAIAVPKGKEKKDPL